MLRQRKKTTLKITIVLTLFFCLISALMYFFIFSPFFRIKEIEISGNQEVAEQDIQDVVRRSISGKRFWLLPKDNIFFIDEQNLATSLKEPFVKLSSVIISRGKSRLVPAILKVEIIERQTQAVVCHYYYEISDCGNKVCPVSTEIDSQISVETQQCCVSTVVPKEIFDKCFYVDQQGIGFKLAPQTQGSLILLAGANYDMNLGWEVVKPHLLEAMIQIKKTISEKIPDVLLSHFLIVSSQEIRLKTQTGWQIYFDAMGNIERQTEILKELLKKEIDKPENLEYIDLRIEERVYYKDVGMESD